MKRRIFMSLIALVSGFWFVTQRGLANSNRKLEEDIPLISKWISVALKSSGYKADFTPESLKEVERFFVEQTANGLAKTNGLLVENPGVKLVAIGFYCGEVLRKDAGGHWITDDNDPEGEINIALSLDNGNVCWPVQRVLKRFRSAEDDLVFWGEVLREK